MGHILSFSLVAGGLALISTPAFRRISGALSAESLRPLSPTAQAAIEAVGARTSPCGKRLEIATSDLFIIWINSRRMVAESDQLRSRGRHSEELNDEHEGLLLCGRILSRQIPMALLERILGHVGYYQTSAAWHYSQQQNGLDFISSESGIPLPENWEAQT